jgi:hypothetical protein
MLATVTSILTVIGTECGKGVATAAGEDIWSRAKALFGWRADPALDKLPLSIATTIHDNQMLAEQLIHLLQTRGATETAGNVVGPLVQNLQAIKSVVANKIDTVNM